MTPPPVTTEIMKPALVIILAIGLLTIVGMMVRRGD